MIEDLLLKNVLKGENSSRKIRNRQSPNFVQRDNFLARLFSRAIWRHVLRIARRSPAESTAGNNDAQALADARSDACVRRQPPE
jgi:hypothetical protein